MIEIMAICKKKYVFVKATFYFQHNGVTAGVFPEGSIFLEWVLHKINVLQ